ncbi:DUF4405 domain-containing protein [Rhizobium sp. RCC_161_2]|uniref:DUF4405 domain-containing protein n=1 Tax=Rhizobium sp. RCC_161_2 TaxID=3239219 RepID=UPI00352514BA
MNSPIVQRLALPGSMAIALLLSLAYWWLDNLAHELFGIVLFALLAWHINVNRVWFRNLLRGGYDALRLATVALHLVLIANMVVLLVTSVAISKSVFVTLPIPDSMMFRDIHWFAAYWVMIIVGIHLGLHWARVMALTRVKLGLAAASQVRTWLFRALALTLAVFSLWSWTVLGVWGKLTFTYSLEFWDFTASVAPFFGYWAGVVSLPVIATHYLMWGWRLGRKKGRSLEDSPLVRGFTRQPSASTQRE